MVDSTTLIPGTRAYKTAMRKQSKRSISGKNDGMQCLKHKKSYSGSIKKTQRVEKKDCLTVIKCNIQQTAQCHFEFMNSVHFFSELMKLYLCNLNNAFINCNTHLYAI